MGRQKKQILIIEDDKNLRETTADFLKEEGFDAIIAANGIEGVKIALEEIPDLILCDIAMPKMEGWEVYKILQDNEETELIPFIFLTAKVTQDDIRKGMSIGADDYITKPFLFNDLLVSVRKRIEKFDKIFAKAFKNMRLIFDKAESGIFILQHELFAYTNSKFQILTGYSEYDLLNTDIETIMNISAEKILAGFETIEPNKQKIINKALEIKHKDKSSSTKQFLFTVANYNGKPAIIGNVIEESASENKFLFNNLAQTEIEQAVSLIEKHQFLLPNALKVRLNEISKENDLSDEYDKPISKREEEVLKLICEGLSSNEIADKLFLSNRTIDRHRANLLAKTESKNTVELVVFAIKKGYYSIN